jgi:mono/diheme cytochrome c family protein
VKKERNHGSALFAVAIAATFAFAFSNEACAQAAGQWKGPEHVYAKICGNCHDIGVGPVIKGRGLDPDYFQSVARHGMRAMPAFRPTDVDDAMLKRVAEMLSKSPAPGGSK